jgi:hypothetical protein
MSVECEECGLYQPLCELDASYEGIGFEVLRMSRLSAQGVTMPSFSEALRIRMMCVLMLERTSMVLNGLPTISERIPLPALREICVDESCITTDAHGVRQILLSPGFRLFESATDKFSLDITAHEPACAPFIEYAKTAVSTRLVQERALPDELVAYAWRAMHERADDPRTHQLRPELRYVFPAQAIAMLFGKRVYARRGWMCCASDRPALWKMRWCGSGSRRALAEQRLGVSILELLSSLEQKADRTKCMDDACVAAHARRGFVDAPRPRMAHTIVAHAEDQLAALSARLMKMDQDAAPVEYATIRIVQDEHDPDVMWNV